VIEYTVDFQVSDYFTFGNIVVTDTVGDGLRLTGTPTLTVTDRDGTVAGNFTSGTNLTVDASRFPAAYGGTGICGNGTTVLTFNVSQAMTDNGATNGIITGGRVNGGAFGTATGQIKFRAIIQKDFACDFPSGNRSVDHGDVLSNNVTISGEVFDNLTQLPQGTPQTTTDGSSASITIAFGGLTKSVYAINGTVCDPCTTQIGTNGINPADTVTFRMRYTLPASNFETTTLTDYLPLPVFNVTSFNTTFNNTICGTPASDNACLGPADTYHSLNGAPTNDLNPVVTPTLAKNTTSNTLAFTYASYNSSTNTSSTLDLLFTLTVTNEPFADGLFLTNQANASEGTTNAGTQTLNSILQVKINQPYLIGKKSAVSTDATNATFTPSVLTATTPITFTTPGIVGDAWNLNTPTPLAHPINSTTLHNGTNYNTTLIDSNLSGVDAGDKIKFAIVIENRGHSPNGAFDIQLKDVIPIEYQVPLAAPGINLQITRGDGTAVAFTGLGGGPDGINGTADDIFGTGIQLTDPGGGGGSCQVHDWSNGKNVIIVTYDLQLKPGVGFGQNVVNQGTLISYGSKSGGTNFIPSGTTDTATVTPYAAPNKAIKSTSESHTADSGGTTASPRPVAIGEIVRYRLEFRIPEGSVDNLRLRDSLPTGLRFLNDNTAKVAFVSNTAITSTTLSGVGLVAVGDETSLSSITPSFVLPDNAVSINDSTATANYTADNNDSYSSGSDVFFKLGNVVNPDNDSNNEYILIEFNALVENIVSNSAGTNRDNTFTYRVGITTTNGTSSNTIRLRIYEPSITNLSKSMVITPTQATNGVVTYRFTFSNANGASNTSARDVLLTDVITTTMSLLPSSVQVTFSGGSSGLTNASTSSKLDVTISTVPAGGGVQVDYQSQFNAPIAAGYVMTNTVNMTYASLAGLNGTTGNVTGSNTPGSSGSSTGRRDGSGTAPNTYKGSSSVTYTVTSAISPVFPTSTPTDDGSAAVLSAGAARTATPTLTHTPTVTRTLTPTGTLTVTPTATKLGIFLFDPLIAKASSLIFAQIGDPIQFVITITNPNAAPVIGIGASDPLPPEVDFINATTTHGTLSYDSTTHRVNFNLGVMAANQVSTLVVNTVVNNKAQPPNPIRNKAFVSVGDKTIVSNDSNVRTFPQGIAGAGEGRGAGEWLMTIAMWLLAGALPLVVWKLSQRMKRRR